ncbi:MAG: sulfatase [Verrucomicrobiota bacterium]
MPIPSTVSPDSAVQPRPAPVFRWVLFTALAYQLVTFAIGLATLAGSTGAMTNKFADIAMDRFQWYLIWNNVDVLVKGYLPLALGFALIIYPVVKHYLRNKPKVTRWGIIWRTLTLAAVITSFCTLRMVHTRPWLLSGLHSDHWYFRIRDLIPASVQPYFFMVMLQMVPALILLALMVYYGQKILRHYLPEWPQGARVAISGMAVAALGVIAWAIPAWHYRVNEQVRTDKRPNILILASDSLRADRLSCNGYERPTSPTIDELAAKSVNFQKCFTPISSTVESLTTMMSSQYPHTHGLQHMFPNKSQVTKVNEKSPALARVLRDQGYDTAVMGDWCAGVFDVMPMGFEKVQATTFDNFKVYMSQAVYLAHAAMPLYYDNPIGYFLFPKLECSAFYVTPDVVTERVVDRLAVQSRSQKPFFWTVFYSCTHIPYTADEKYSSKFTDPKYQGPHKHQFQFNVDQWIGSVDMANKWRTMPEEDVAQINGLYDGCVRKFDDCVKTVLDQLKATGQLDNTIVLITGDHGDDLFEPNTTFGHGLSFNGGDQNSNIPAILYVPGRGDKPEKVTKVVRSIDFAPTLLDLTGMGRDPRMEGTSLMPYLKDPKADLGLAFFGETSYLFCKRYIPGEEPLSYDASMDSTTQIDEDFDCHFVLKDKYQELVIQTKERVLRTEQWKLVFTPGQHYDIVRLYDLRTDPHCEHDVKLLYPETFATMKEHLWKWMRDKQESRIPEIFPGGEPSSARPAA